MTTYYVLFTRHGPRWDDAQGVREQACWDEHARFMDALFETGAIILAGPFADQSGSMLVLRARSAAHASELMADDPWAAQDILLISEVKEWTIFLESR